MLRKLYLHVYFFQKMSSYRREFDGTKYKFININEYKFKFRKNITKFGK